jgi:hypothetical protein
MSRPASPTGRGRGSPSVYVRMSKEEREQIRRDAAAHPQQLSEAELLRRAYFGARNGKVTTAADDGAADDADEGDEA